MLLFLFYYLICNKYKIGISIEIYFYIFYIKKKERKKNFSIIFIVLYVGNLIVKKEIKIWKKKNV